MVAPLPVDAREGDPSLDAFVADVLPYPMGNDRPRTAGPWHPIGSV